MNAMKELHDMGVSYDEALANFESKIEEGRRQWAAKILQAYPFRRELELVAEALREDLQAKEIEVNSISSDSQTTVAKAPPRAPLIIPVQDSLCVMTVGSGLAGQVSDTQHDLFTAHHSVMKRLDIGSWASVPIHIAGTDAGTVCALQGQPRSWDDDEQKLMEVVADKIGELVTDWAAHANLSQLL